MATNTWKGGAGGHQTDWTDKSNWSRGAVPATTDDIVIPGTATATSQPTISTATDVTISSLTLDATATLTFSAAVTLTLNGSGTSTGVSNSGTIALSTGTITTSAGTITNNTGGVITITTGALDDTATTGTGISNAGGMITVGTGTVSSLSTSASAVSNSGGGTIDISTGGTLSAASGGITNTGSSSNITGAGTLTGAVTNSSSALIAVTGGNMTANSGITNSAEITIASGDTLSSTTTITNNSSGAISLSGGTLSSTGGSHIVDNSGGVISGFGTVSGALSGTGGTVTASGGTLALTSNIATSSGPAFHVADSAASILKLNGTVGGGNAFSFIGTHGALELNDVTITPSGLNFSGTVSGLDVNTSATPNLGTTDYINVQTAPITNAVLTSSTNIELFTTGNVVLGNITLASATSAAHVDWFADSGATGSIIGSGTDIILSNVVCFAAGTRILTPTGERMVESLLPGDIVLTLPGEELKPQPVKWLGRRRIDLAAHPRPETVAPVRIQRGAFADSMPHGDLLVSPDHAILVDGKLICARQLVNGTTIRQEKGQAAVEYFHVELNAHAILLAEGLPAESYLNTGNRGFFANSGEPLVLHPDLTDETDYPTREAASCVPFVWDEASVRPVWQRLAERAAALGQPAPQRDTTTDPELRVVAKGRSLRPLYGENGLYVFALPKGATEVRVVSRAGAPTDVRPWLEDRRCLGVYAARIVLRGATEVWEVPVDHPSLSQGWWAVEWDGTALRRWTNGDALLPLPSFEFPAMLEIQASNGGMAYLTDAELDRRAA